MTDQFENWLRKAFGTYNRPHGGRGNDEYVIDCPDCGAKKRLYLNPVKRMFRCMKGCDAGDLIRWMQKHTKLNGYQIKAILDDEPGVEDFDAEINTLFQPSEKNELDHVPTYMQDFAALGHDPHIDDRVRRFLTPRGFTMQDAKQWGLAYAWRGKFAGRLIIPVYEHGELVYFQARAMFGENPKYLNPRVPRGEVLFNAEIAQATLRCNKPGSPPTLFITEGAFNAMSAGSNSVAIFGKVMSPVQEARIMQMLTSLLPSKAQVVVALDHGAEREAIEIASRLYSMATVGVLYMADDRDLNDLRAAGLPPVDWQNVHWLD